jgi:hypothetical protein
MYTSSKRVWYPSAHLTLGGFATLGFLALSHLHGQGRLSLVSSCNLGCTVRGLALDVQAMLVRLLPTLKPKAKNRVAQSIIVDSGTPAI